MSLFILYSICATYLTLSIDEHGDICWRNIIGPDNFRPAFMQKVGFYITDIAGAPSHYVLGYIE